MREIKEIVDRWGVFADYEVSQRDSFIAEIRARAEEEKKQSYDDGFQTAWSRNVKSNLCYMYEHDVRWCDECSNLRKG